MLFIGNLFKNDPVHFINSKLTPEEINLIIQLGPCQPCSDDLPQKHFPFDKTSRHGHFNEQWYSRLLPDGSRVIRDWLSYSPTLDTVFCLPCMLFTGHNKHKAVTTWTKVGYSTWQNGRQNIMLHEISNIHVNASITLKTKKNSMPIIPALESSRKTNVALNRQIVFELIDITLYLARHNLSFRGHREGWDEKNKGNFKDILLLMAPNSYALSSHINSIKSQGKHVCSFISWERQNQLISSISEFIGSTIRSDIKRSRMFSISIDSTFDAARKEQVSFIIRYVSHSSGKIFERLLALKESPVTTGESLFDLFELVMDREGLDWKNELVGQSYDGASNMSGEYKGLQARINAKNNSAIFVWCHAHRLNLVMANAVSSSLDAVDLFGNLESIYSFIWCSKKRAALFREFQDKHYPNMQKKSMKRVATTRWGSHDAALETVLQKFDAILETLEETRRNEGSGDVKVGSTIAGFMKYFLSYRFVLTAYTFKKIFTVLSPLSKIMQSVDIDLLTVTNIVETSKHDLNFLRDDDNTFDNLYEQAQSFIDKSDYEFEVLRTTRIKKVPRKHDEKCTDERIQDPIQLFKINTVLPALDHVNNEMNKRFNPDHIGILKDISLFSLKRIEEIMKKPILLPIDSFVKLCNTYKILDINCLRTEYLQFTSRFPEIKKTLILPTKLHTETELNKSDDEEFLFSDASSGMDDNDNKTLKENKKSKSLIYIFNLLHSTGLDSVFPHLYSAIKIAVTLPVSSCSTERSFSKMKLVKTRLRSSTSEDRLEGLVKISCENDIVIDKDLVVDIFAQKSSVLIKSLIL